MRKSPTSAQTRASASSASPSLTKAKSRRTGASSKKLTHTKPSSTLEDIGAKLEVRRHPGARRLTLRISRTRRAVVVTIPVQCDLDEAGSFLNRHIDWVRERLDSLPDSVPFEHGVMMPLRGVPHRVVFTNTKDTRIVTCVAFPACNASAPGASITDIDAKTAMKWPEIHVPGDVGTASLRLKSWLFDEARRDLAARVAYHATGLRLNPSRIAVRDQTSRWGSCSTTGVLSFSWRLVLAPPHVLDYVAGHEVAHLAEMNHGPRFWALVRRITPAFETSKAWLQVYGPDLHRYGSASNKLA